jgi:alpha-ribazole phosphatase
MEIYVIRHLKCDVPAGVCAGQTNYPLLTPTLSLEFASKIPTDFDLVYSSPLPRCLSLAEQINASVHYDDRLKEINFGDWEGQKWDDINQDALNHWMADFVHISPPNGDNLLVFYSRVQEFIEELRQKPDKKILIIAHAGVIRVIFALILGFPLENLFKIKVGYEEVYHFTLGVNANEDMIYFC